MQVSRCCCLDQAAPPEVEILVVLQFAQLKEDPDNPGQWLMLQATGNGPSSGWDIHTTDFRITRQRSVFTLATTYSSPVTSATLRFWTESIQAPSAPPGYIQNFSAGFKTYYEPLTNQWFDMDAQAIETAAFHPGAAAWSATASDTPWTIEETLDVTTALNAVIADGTYDGTTEAFFLVHDWNWPNFGTTPFQDETRTIPTNSLTQPQRPIIEVQP